jgi:hypothetical protein
MWRKPIEPDRGLVLAAMRYAGARFHQIAYLTSQYVRACESGHKFLATRAETNLRRKLLEGLVGGSERSDASRVQKPLCRK